MKIGEFIRKAETTVTTVRQYEELGLIPAFGPMKDGERVYTMRDVERIRFVREARIGRFPLKLIRDFALAFGEGENAAGFVLIRGEHELKFFDQQIEHLKSEQARLRGLLDRLKSGDGPDRLLLLDLLFALRSPLGSGAQARD